MPPPALLRAFCCCFLAAATRAGFLEDRCSWRGSGVTQEPSSVGQLALASAEGGVEWLYPFGALRLTLGSSDSGAQLRITCLRLPRPFAGVQVFAERAGGVLELLLAESQGPAGGGKWALFLQATLHRDISRRVASFLFELREDRRPELPPRAHGLGEDGWSWRPLWEATGITPSVCQSVHKDTELQVGACRPCSDVEFLLALCTNDFELQESVITVTAARVLRQTLLLFQVEGPGGQVRASIHTPLRCGVCPGPGTLLFMGWSHFGEAWLGCAPRIQEFSCAYAAARAIPSTPARLVALNTASVLMTFTFWSSA